MANLFWQNCGIRVGGTNLSGYLNKVSLKVTAAALDATTFTNSYQVRLGGLKEITMERAASGTRRRTRLSSQALA